MSGAFDGAALGTRVKLLRKLRGMSLQRVADAAGLSKPHVWEMEQGKSVNPTVNAVWGLARALSVAPGTLLGLDDKVPNLDPFALKLAGMIDREIRSRTKAEGEN
jgi:transcriptional regulator with XRE-family HTH domain